MKEYGPKRPQATTPASTISTTFTTIPWFSLRFAWPLMLAIIGGPPKRFAGYVDLYRRAAEQFGTTAHPVGMIPSSPAPWPKVSGWNRAPSSSAPT